MQCLRYVLKAKLRCDTKGVAHITRQFRPVQRVEMQIFHAAFDQVTAQLGCNRGCQQIVAVIAQGLAEGMNVPPAVKDPFDCPRYTLFCGGFRSLPSTPSTKSGAPSPFTSSLRTVATLP